MQFRLLHRGSGAGGQSPFIELLKNWTLPPWIRPVAYVWPQSAGLDGQSIVVLEVGDPQSEPLAQSRLGEYFLEMGWVELAAKHRARLRRYRTDAGAMIALCQLEAAAGDVPESDALFEALLALLKNVGDRNLPWDRRVSLATLLASRRRLDLAREQVRRCAADASEPWLRALSTSTLYRLRMLQKITAVEFADAKLAALDEELLPRELRERIRAR